MPSDAAAWSDELCADYARFLRGRLQVERSWVVVVGGQVAGVLRLQPQAEGTHEVGAWLGRRWRNQGFGSAALTALRELAPRIGVRSLRAETTEANVAAVRLVRAQGAALSSDGDAVHALWEV